MSATTAPLVINGQTVSTTMVVIPGLLDVSVSALIGADPAFPGYRQLVDFDPIGDWMCKGAELGDAVPVAASAGRVHDFGGRQFFACECHCLTWPASMVVHQDEADTFECPRDDNPLPASFQRQAMR